MILFIMNVYSQQKERFLRILTDIFIISVTLHRCKPKSYTFEASNGEYETSFNSPYFSFDAIHVTAIIDSVSFYGILSF